MTDWTPCIVRVAGLPASTLEAFAGSLGGRIDAVDELEAELSAARSDAVELLFQHVPGASPDERRQLLKWKRKCFNGRPVGGDVAAGLADPFPAAVRETLAGLAGLESKVASARSALRDAYADQLLRERRQLVDAAQDPGIRRGIALASASTAASLHRTANFFGGSLDRRDRKLEQSLTRFVSRAAHKTSPFSALTAVGLGRLVDLESAGNAPRWLPGETRVRALLRLKRYLFHQLAETLCAVPRYRGHLKLVLNNSLESIGPGRARFFRRGFRGPDPETGGTRLNRPSIVRLDMDRGLVEALRERCGGRVFGFDEAESTLRPFVDSADDVAPIADHLLALGCLEPVLPWCNTDVRAETKFLEFLRSLPFDDALGEVIVACEELIELEDGFTDADDPVHAVRDIPRLLAKAWAGVAALAGLRPDAKFVMSPKGDLYEDVVVENPAQERSEVLEIPASTIATIHKDLEPLLTVGAFLTRRVDCLINLRAFARREWPGQNRVGLMDLFAKAQPLYRQFLAAESEAIKKGEWASTFNPSDLDELRLAAERRGEIAAVLDSCLVPSETGAEIDRAKMRRLADRVPAAYRPSVGGCLFLQPAKADGSLWVLNRMYEGTGRYSSRYTAVMGDDQRSAFAERLRAGSTFEVDGRPAELVDLLCAQGDTLNVHALQTERVIEFPGEDSGAPRHRRLALQDLSVEISQDDDGVPLRLLDADGRWILPAHLGGTILRFMPIMVKFLALFGPGDLRRANPMPALREENGVPVRDRVTLGKVVLLRKQWRTKPADLVAEVARKSEAEAFERVHRWRNERGVPERVFMVEKRPSRLNLELYKPQYVDFRSPSLVKIFLAAAATTPELLVLMEALPTTEEFPETSDGQRRLVEVQCESISAQGAPSSVPPAGGAETPVPLTGAVTNRG